MDESFQEELSQRIAQYTDEQIKEILKKRSQFNNLASRLAIDEAIKRKIINSELDLLGEEYKEKPRHFHIFPEISKPQISIRIFKSLTRSILLIGIIPIIFAYLKMNDHKFSDGAILLSIGLIWIIFSALLLWKMEMRYGNLILLITVLSIFYLTYILIQQSTIKFMDLFIAFIFYCLVFYSIMYIKRLLKAII